jgi:hypothetical protein
MRPTNFNAYILRRIDMALYTGDPVVVGTQFGDVSIRKALTPGYVAEVRNSWFADMCTYGLTPSIAFVNLGFALKAVRLNPPGRTA